MTIVDNFASYPLDTVPASVYSTDMQNTTDTTTAQATIRQMLDIFENATVRDLVTMYQYPRNETVRSLASAALKARGLCGACGSAAHTFCNR